MAEGGEDVQAEQPTVELIRGRRQVPLIDPLPCVLGEVDRARVGILPVTFPYLRLPLGKPVIRFARGRTH